MHKENGEQTYEERCEESPQTASHEPSFSLCARAGNVKLCRASKVHWFNVQAILETTCEPTVGGADGLLDLEVGTSNGEFDSHFIGQL